MLYFSNLPYSTIFRLYLLVLFLLIWYYLPIKGVFIDGCALGCLLGWPEGCVDGRAVGWSDGHIDGYTLGCSLG